MRFRPAGVLVLVALAAPPASAGPWAVGKGHFYTKLSYRYLNATNLSAPDGTDFEIPAFRQDYLDLYAAVGIDDRFTLSVDLPVLRSSDLDDDPDELQRESGFGDLRFGVQAQLGRRGPWTFATRVNAQAPTGDPDVSDGLQATGSGVWEGDATIGAGRSLAGGKGFTYLEAGYNYRGEGLRDGFLYEFQLGWNLGARLVLLANLRGLQPFDTSPGEVNTASLSGFGDRVTYTVYGPSAIVKLGSGFGLQLDLEGSFNTRNMATGTVFRGCLTFAR